MQSLIVLALFILVSTLGVVEFNKNDHSNKHTSAEIKASITAGNIMQYNDMVYRYALAEYDTLHEMSTQNPGHIAEGNIEQVSLLDVTKLNNYHQKQYKAFLDYRTVFFNYVRSMEQDTMKMPTLYFVTTWSDRGYKNNMFDVVGQLNQLFTQHIYQGHGSYWVVPWIGKVEMVQDGSSQGKCKVKVYSQIPKDVDGRSKAGAVIGFLEKFCQYFVTYPPDRYNFTFDKYIYVQPVYK